MPNDVKLAELSAALIRVFEGLKVWAYDDVTGRPIVLPTEPVKGMLTLGYGHIKGVKPGDTCTEAQAEAWLMEDAAPLFKAVEGIPLLRAAALVSFGYNCGLGALRKVLAGQAHPEDFIRAKGKVLPGLVSRRKLEALLMTISEV